MYLKKLVLNHFRNYEYLDLSLETHIGITLIGGANGAGKTNLLEAIHFLCLTRGFHAEKHCCRQPDANYFRIAGTWQSNETNFETACAWQEKKGKKFWVDGIPLSKYSDHIGRIPVVTVMPGDIELIRGSGTDRRKWIDTVMAQADKNVLLSLTRYAHALKQRNQLLIQAKNTHINNLQLQLAGWEQHLIQEGCFIQEARETFLEQFIPFFIAAYRQLSGNKEIAGLTYLPKIPKPKPEIWHKLFEEYQYIERKRGQTFVGIHRDDLAFKINQQPVRDFGSQGQQKSYLLALKIAQYHYLYQKLDILPVLLLDDLFDRLDPARTHHFAALLHTLSGMIWITDPNPEKLALVHQAGNRPVIQYEITNGKIINLD
jgi:DNA replication and repair protein RecF